MASPAYNKPPAYEGQPKSPNGKAPMEGRRKVSSAGSTTSLLGNLRSKFRNSSLAGQSGSRGGIEGGFDQPSVNGESVGSAEGSAPTRSIEARAASTEVKELWRSRCSELIPLAASLDHPDGRYP